LSKVLVFYLNESIIFGSIEKDCKSQNFKGGKVDCVFGGLKLDLRGIKVAKEGAELEINAIFGGGEIWVSEKTRVVSQGSGVFGGWENKYSTDNTAGLPILRLTGTAVFGGVEVKS
jgi:hypothetical protein